MNKPITETIDKKRSNTVGCWPEIKDNERQRELFLYNKLTENIKQTYMSVCVSVCMQVHVIVWATLSQRGQSSGGWRSWVIIVNGDKFMFHRTVVVLIRTEAALPSTNVLDQSQSSVSASVTMHLLWMQSKKEVNTVSAAMNYVTDDTQQIQGYVTAKNSNYL